MVSGEAIIVMDLGNSSTKVTVMNNKDKDTGKYQEHTFELSNVFAPIAEDYEISSDYSEATSTVLKVNEEFNGHTISGLFCNGELQKRERPSTIIKPSAFDKKWKLDATVLSIRLAFLHAYRELMNMRRVTDPKQIDVTWKVVTMLPPGDYDKGKEPLADIIRNVTSVDSVFPQVHFDIKVDKVMVYPEGFGAYVGVVFDKGNAIRHGYGYLKNETILIFDIGAGTTDCLVIKNNAMVQSSKQTVEAGGINVYQLVRRNLMTEGISIDDDDLKRGIITGYIKDGAKQVDITNIVNSAREEVANKIVTSFQDYIDGTDLPFRSIGYILPCGGGSMRSESDRIISLSSKLLEKVKEISPNIEIINLPREKVRTTDENGESVVVERTMEPRMLNLIGACVLAELG